MALQHAVEADIHYRDGFYALAPASRCPLPTNSSYELAKKSDVLATAAKQRFVAVFNQLARRVNRRTWRAIEI